SAGSRWRRRGTCACPRARWWRTRGGCSSACPRRSSARPRRPIRSSAPTSAQEFPSVDGTLVTQRYFVFGEEHEEYRQSVRSFVARELAPHAEEWERAEDFP